MTIIRAAVSGMCEGVRRAEGKALEAARQASAAKRRVFTYGPLIHNPQALAELGKRGIEILDTDAFERGEIDGAVRNSIVVIRAHGAPPAAFGRLAALGASVIDATCPRVLASQEKARRLSENGFCVVIAGDRAHAEVVSILGHAPGSFVVQDEREAAALAARLGNRKIALIAQTTIKESEFDGIARKFGELCPNFTAFRTICPATAERQAALRALAERVDAVIVVGGKNSANTRRLFLAALESGKPCWHIETPSELPAEIFSFRSAGLAAGASTPDSMVDEVEKYLLDNAPKDPSC